MKTIKGIMTCLVAACLTLSCEDWLDVKPKAQVESSELLSTESGFKDALWGVYTLMTDYSMYGFNMTVATDAMAKIYSNIGASSTEYQLSNYGYDNTRAKNAITGVWQNTYAAIANLNNLIYNIQQADPDIFSQDNYQVIYGEALGLRAFLHFDLLRLFAPSYQDDSEAEAIPYVTNFTNTVTASSSVKETVELILKDLETAMALLKESDPVCTKREISGKDDNGYLLDRKFRFNYYAVVATMARVYLWKGDETNAAAKAQEVIDHSGCKWTSVDHMAVTNEKRDRTFTSEQIFVLKVEQMEDHIQYAFSTIYAWATGYSLSVSYNDANRIFPYASDWRGWNTLYAWSENLGINSYMIYRFPTKLCQYENMTAEFKCLMPLIRLPEMKLIVAECQPETQGVAIINEIRENRGITEKFAGTATKPQVLEEIRNEYRREFYTEGVVWYYYKRLNLEYIPYFYYGYDYTQAMNRERYVWPMPEEEIEFGNRNSKTEK